MLACAVCHGRSLEELFASTGPLSVTSLSKVQPGITRVRRCAACGHLQTEALPDLATFYDTEYRLLSETAEEDLLYAVAEDGTPIYRTDHLVDVFLTRVDLPEGAAVLDYGCAKGLFMRRLLKRRPDVRPFLFDVSDTYSEHWKGICGAGSQATYEIPSAWQGKMTAVVSCDVLEHVPAPGETLRAMRGLLEADGVVFLTVPNVFANIADFVVADHIHHYSRTSLLSLLSAARLEPRVLSDKDHQSSWVIVAGQDATPGSRPPPSAPDETELRRAQEMAAYWQGMTARVRSYEAEATTPLAIYGAGFYGCYVWSSLAHPEQIRCFVDRSSHRQGSVLGEAQILAPEDLPTDVGTVIVALNPRIAREAVRGVTDWADRDITFLFLDDA